MEVIAARSDARGTMLPRRGFFPSVHAPDYQTAVIEGELPGIVPGGGTSSLGWPELYGRETTQTPPASTLADRLLMAFWSPSFSPAVRRTAVAYAILSSNNEPTDSPWRELRRTLQPLRAASDALLEDTSDTLKAEPDAAALARHAGLAAVARLVDVLGLSRPVILRMGGVPTSTFYAWQKNPRSVIRTPTVTRLLRLQAQVAILGEAIGMDRMRAWIIAADRFDELQGDDAEFARVLAEAQEAVAEATRIRPRRRMQRSDYAAISSEMTQESSSTSPAFPGAMKISGDQERNLE